MSITTQSLAQRNTKDKQDDAFSELKSLLSELVLDQGKGNPKKYDPLEGFHSQLVDDAIAEESDTNVNKIPKNNGKSSTLFSYFVNFTKSGASENDMTYGSEKLKNEGDNASIYEDEKSQTKTIYRSDSFDDSEDDLVAQDKIRDVDSLANDSDHGFHLEDFSDTFNLDDDSDDDSLGLPKTLHTKSEESLGHDAEITHNKKIVKKLSMEIADNFPSVGSSGSFQFNDILTGDILGELEAGGNGDNRLDGISSCSSLSLEEDRIVNLIITKLKEQLQPTLEKLSHESEKYELIKTVYKLPSVTNLNEEIKLKYTGKGKKFNLDFDKSMIGGMVKKELSKTERRKKQFTQVSMISAEDQVRLNFNKFRQLNTIVEEQESDRSFDKLETPAQNYVCMSQAYSKSKDTRRVEELETQELIFLLQKIKEGKLKEMSKVEHLVTMFEEERENVINRLDNSKLKSVILRELNIRKVI